MVRALLACGAQGCVRPADYLVHALVHVSAQTVTQTVGISIQTATLTVDSFAFVVQTVKTDLKSLISFCTLKYGSNGLYGKPKGFNG